MAVDPTTPADTNMMRIVHSALRRDLERARSALTANPPPIGRHRLALARHLGWMMVFLEAHHRSEDEGLYPPVHERATDAALLLHEMARDHAAVADAVAAVEATARRYEQRDEREPLIAALDGLRDVLLPHLQREEDELMPVVSRVMTTGEWNAIEQAHNLAGKSKAQLGREGHWLIDGASHEDRARVLGLVPLLPRLILLYGFGPSYRRHQRICWNTRRHHVAHEGSTSIVVDADLDAVWDISAIRPESGNGATNASPPSGSATPAHAREPDSGGATDTASSDGDGCATSSASNRASSSGAQSPTAAIPTAPNGRSAQIASQGLGSSSRTGS